MNITSKTYTVTITYQGESHTFTKNLSHDCHLTQEEIDEAIVLDFFQEVMVEIDFPPCCPICSSKTFDGCPACEDYL
jgi:hypothetical protein